MNSSRSLGIETLIVLSSIDHLPLPGCDKLANPEQNSNKLFRSRRTADNDTELVLFAHLLEMLFGFGGFELAIPHGGIEAALCEEIGMPTAFGDAAVLEHDDLVGLHHR